MNHDHLENALPHPNRGRSLRLASSVSAQSIAEFCASLEFAVHNQAITEGERRSLRKALSQIAREAHAAHMLPEHLLIGLREVWSAVCGHTPGPDMYDAAWHLVVDECLKAYEAARP